MSKEQKIIEQARKYIDAARSYRAVSEHISSLQRLGFSQLLQAENEEQRTKIAAKLKEDISRSIDEAVQRISPPIIALNQLVEVSDEPVYFSHNGQELMVVPDDDRSAPHQKFSVRLKDEGPETAV